MITNLKDLGVVLSLIASVVLGWVWLDKYYAKDRVVQAELLELRQEGLEDDIEQDAGWAADYRRKARDGIASDAEIDRLERLEKNLERKYKKAELYDQMQAQMRAE